MQGKGRALLELRAPLANSFPHSPQVDAACNEKDCSGPTAWLWAKQDCRQQRGDKCSEEERRNDRRNDSDLDFPTNGGRATRTG